MDTTTILFVVILAALVLLYIQTCNENFYIEPNTVTGGVLPQSGMDITTGEDNTYTAPLELEGPGDAAWSGY